MYQGLALMVGPWLVFRLLGTIGIRRFASWRDCAAYGLAVMLLFTGSAHFTPDSLTVMPSHDDLTAMVPPWVPAPDFMVYASGVLEFAGALGLVLPATRRAAGICLALLFLTLIPANIDAAMNDIPLNGDPATPLWFRIPEQLVYITIAVWSSSRARPRDPSSAMRADVPAE